MIVDLHTHFFPETWPDLAERFGTPDWPWMRRDGPDQATVMLGGAGVPPDHVGLLGRRRPPGRHGPRRRRRAGRLGDAGAVRLRPPGRAGDGVRPHLQRRPARAVRGRRRPPRADRPGAAAGHRPGLPRARALPRRRHAGRADRQPRRRPRPRRRRPRRPSSPTARSLGAAGVRAPVGHVRRVPAGGLDARAGRSPCRPRRSCR